MTSSGETMCSLGCMLVGYLDHYHGHREAYDPEVGLLKVDTVKCNLMAFGFRCIRLSVNVTL